MCVATEEMRMDCKIEGMREGRREGMREGMREGRREGMREGKREGRYEGEMKGVIETYKEFGISMQETVRRIVDKFHISLQQSEEEVKKYWEDC